MHNLMPQRDDRMDSSPASQDPARTVDIQALEESIAYLSQTYEQALRRMESPPFHSLLDIQDSILRQQQGRQSSASDELASSPSSLPHILTAHDDVLAELDQTRSHLRKARQEAAHLREALDTAEKRLVKQRQAAPRAEIPQMTAATETETETGQGVHGGAAGADRLVHFFLGDAREGDGKAVVSQNAKFHEGVLQWDYVIVVPNPDHPSTAKRKRGVTYEEAEALFRKSFRGEEVFVNGVSQQQRRFKVEEEKFMEAFEQLPNAPRRQGWCKRKPASSSKVASDEVHIPIVGGEEKLARDGSERKAWSHGGGFSPAEDRSAAGKPRASGPSNQADADSTAPPANNAPQSSSFVAAGHGWCQSRTPVTCFDFMSLVRNVIVTKLVHHLNFTVEMAFSSNYQFIYILVACDEQDLESAALRRGYPLAINLLVADPESYEPCTSRFTPLAELFYAGPQEKQSRQVQSAYRDLTDTMLKQAEESTTNGSIQAQAAYFRRRRGSLERLAHTTAPKKRPKAPAATPGIIDITAALSAPFKRLNIAKPDASATQESAQTPTSEQAYVDEWGEAEEAVRGEIERTYLRYLEERKAGKDALHAMREVNLETRVRLREEGVWGRKLVVKMRQLELKSVWQRLGLRQPVTRLLAEYDRTYHALLWSRYPCRKLKTGASVSIPFSPTDRLRLIYDQIMRQIDLYTLITEDLVVDFFPIVRPVDKLYAHLPLRMTALTSIETFYALMRSFVTPEDDTDANKGASATQAKAQSDRKVPSARVMIDDGGEMASRWSKRAQEHRDVTQDDEQAVENTIEEASGALLFKRPADEGCCGCLRSTARCLGAMFEDRNEAFYYGEKIAVYFCFLRHYSACMLWPAALGMAFQILYYLDFDDEFEYRVGLVNALFLSIWTTCFLIAWERKQLRIALWFGRVGHQEAVSEPPRMQFFGILRRSPVTGEPGELYFAPLRKYARISVAAVVSVLFSLVALGLVILILSLKKTFANKGWFYVLDYDMSGHVVGLLTAIQLNIFNAAYRPVCLALTKWENHRTYSLFQYSYAVKSFLFMFVNSYASLFFIAFAKEHREGCRPNCMDELNAQLTSLIVIRALMNVVELGRPWIVAQWKERQRTKEDGVKGGPGGAKGVSRIIQQVDSEMEMDPYGEAVLAYDGTINDYLELSISFGFLALFSISFPLAGLLVFLASLFELYVDTTKLKTLVRRPHPQAEFDIGCWHAIFSGLNYLAIFTNASLLSFTAKVRSAGGILPKAEDGPQGDDDDDPLDALESLFFYCFAFLFIKFALQLLLPGNIDAVDTAIERLRCVLERIKRPMTTKRAVRSDQAIEEHTNFTVRSPNDVPSAAEPPSTSPAIPSSRRTPPRERPKEAAEPVKAVPRPTERPVDMQLPQPDPAVEASSPATVLAAAVAAPLMQVKRGGDMAQAQPQQQADKDGSERDASSPESKSRPQGRGKAKAKRRPKPKTPPAEQEAQEKAIEERVAASVAQAKQLARDQQMAKQQQQQEPSSAGPSTPPPLPIERRPQTAPASADTTPTGSRPGTAVSRASTPAGRSPVKIVRPPSRKMAKKKKGQGDGEVTPPSPPKTPPPKLEAPPTPASAAEKRQPEDNQ
ncbi:unnamed protein product [Vitrella brassicaformis CCMP3155]|uniref:Anoctamin transmembrane domain-containing protein n=6 Tax=Vitrella brassicaformis TaxID=1169539 RepID=A0A0G4FP47_VITBC|nr:unnamed protein product [Vitrella brassicaformis CCMP3155]|eukprot:CEM16007.1 unnamed protein product [Vitrella brassicaformis CCMP3155]